MSDAAIAEKKWSFTEIYLFIPFPRQILFI